MKRLMTIILLLCSVCGYASGEYVVATLQQFSDALKQVKAGDCIIWKDGSYEDMKIDFSPSARGTAGKPIVLKAQTPGKVIFTGSSQVFITGEYLQVEGFLFKGPNTLPDDENVVEFGADDNDKMTTNHCRLTNCAIIDYAPSDISFNQNYVTLKGIRNEVDHCSFSGKTNKGPVMIVAYKKSKNYKDGSDEAPSTYHHIHHNYFGFRTYPENGGEDIRVGDSKTSFTHGFNIVEYNYFEDERLEAEVISNKSWDNIYRFNTFVGNDGALVLRHGQQCFAYGNYFNGATGRNTSGGIRIINANQTVFNNYLENLEGGAKALKAPLCIMSGLEGSPLNGYYPADNALVAYNTVVGSVGPIIRIAVGNSNKGKALIAPQALTIAGNVLIDVKGKNEGAVMEDAPVTYRLCADNVYTNGGFVSLKGFEQIKSKIVVEKDGIKQVTTPVNEAVLDTINERLKPHNIKLTEKEITRFDPKWIMKKTDVGASWMKL